MSTKPGATTHPSASIVSTGADVTEATHGDDATVAHPDVGGVRGQARAVDDGAAAHQQVELRHARGSASVRRSYFSSMP